MMEEHAREVLGLPPEWRFLELEVLGHGTPRVYLRIKGAVVPKVITKGPRKGKPNYKFREREAEIIFSVEEQDAWEAAWEKRTGLCRRCGDEGLLTPPRPAAPPMRCPCGRKPVEASP
jgi:hypothetical protein